MLNACFQNEFQGAAIKQTISCAYFDELKNKETLLLGFKIRH